MRVDDLETLYDYSAWANRKLFDVIAQLTPEQFTLPVAGSYGSIRNTLVHVLSAEWGWLDRCGGPERGERLRPEAYPTLQSLVDGWARVEGSMRELLSGLRDDELARTIEFAMGTGDRHSMPLGELMQHAMLHGVHHRGQVALLLRALGYAPGNFDMFIYFAERQTRGAPRVR